MTSTSPAFRYSTLFACAWLSLGALFLGACGGGGSGGGPPRLDGEVLFVPVDGAEVNLGSATASLDATRQATRLPMGRRVRVRGERVEGVDVARLVFDTRTRVRVHVPEESGRAALLDPLSLDFGPAGNRLGFLARGPVDLVVRGEDGPYTLVVSSEPVSGPVDWDGPLGAFAAGERLELLAGGAAAAWLTAAESLDLSVDAEGAVRALGRGGVELGQVGAEGGRLQLALAPLERVELVSSGPARARLASEPAAAPRPAAVVAAAENERGVFALGAEQRLVGEITYEFMPGEALVRARAGRTLDVAGAARGFVRRFEIPETSELWRVELPADLNAEQAARTTLALIASFEVSADVEWAEPNRIRRPMLQTTPNDPFYGFQWHYDLVRLPQAWDITTGDSAVIVAVLDTGERSHPDLNANTVAGYDFISDPINSGDGGGIDPDPTDVGDGSGIKPSSFHGTHVAGTIGAVGNNGLGISGVNWDVGIMHLRVLGKLGGTDADIAQAVRYAAGLTNSSGTVPAQRAHVINMSLGGSGSTSTMQSAVTAARNAGVVLFGAAGNSNVSTPFFPAAYGPVVSVMAVDRNAAKAPYSNFGSTIDLAAPGGDVSVDLDGDGYPDGVLSTLVTQPPEFAPIYVFLQGTSMACPHVAGIAALMFAVNPDLTPAQVETILKSTTIDLGAPGKDNIFGHGLVQADLAVQAAQGAASTEPLLAAGPALLQFGSELTQLNISVANAGGGNLVVGTPTFTPAGGAPVFASLTTVAGQGGTNVGSVQVQVDRSELDDGTYIGTVTIPSNGGTVEIQVAMTVATPLPPVDVDLYLLLIRFPSFETVAQAVINPTSGLEWVLDEEFDGGPIPSGAYILVCGSDDDDDFFIFGEDDLYVGAWPTLNAVEILPLSKGAKLSGLDFVVWPAATFEGLSAALQAAEPVEGDWVLPPEGLRRLR